MLRFFKVTVFVLLALSAKSCLMLPPPQRFYTEVENKPIEATDGLEIWFSTIETIFGKQSFISSSHTFYIVNKNPKTIVIDSLRLTIEADIFEAQSTDDVISAVIAPRDTLVLEPVYTNADRFYAKEKSSYLRSLENEMLKISVAINDKKHNYLLTQASSSID